MAKILIVEDESEMAERIAKCLLENGFPKEQIKGVKSFEKAKEKLEIDNWDFVILDVNILENENDSYQTASKKNSERLMDLIRQENLKRPDHQIKVIYSTGSKEAIHYKSTFKGQEWVLNVIEKFASNEYEEALIGTIKKELANPQVNTTVVEYSGIPKDVQINLKATNQKLFFELEKILKSYDNKQYKEVIMSCGAYVEVVINAFPISELSQKANIALGYLTAADKLGLLRGRLWDRENRKMQTIDLPMQLISEKTFEYSCFVCECRNSAAHDNLRETRRKYNMFFQDSDAYTTHTAAISLQLLVPIIQDYIKYREPKS